MFAHEETLMSVHQRMRRTRWICASIAFVMAVGCGESGGSGDAGTDSGVIATTGVTLDRETLELAVGGGAATLVATVSPPDATDRSVTWTSSNTSIATVSPAGLVSAVGAGAATITVTTVSGGHTDSASVAVSIVAVTGVTLDTSMLSKTTADAPSQLTATLVPSSAGSPAVTWTTSNSNVALVSATGSVRATGVGTATITVTTVNGSYTDQCVVTVTPVPVLTAQERLAAFAEWRYGMFLHFNMGTFTNEEWASPNYPPATFAPTAVDTEQWATVAQAAKMKFGILTTKHHDGFCLWDCAGTTYDVMSSGYQHDVVQQYVDSFRARGLKVGLYFSIWDKTQGVVSYGRHNGTQGDFVSTEDVDYTLEQARQLLTSYGQIDLFMMDGYAWQGGQQAVPYQRIRELVHSLQPNCVVMDINALTIPFLGDAVFFEEPFGVTSPVGNTLASVQGTTLHGNNWFWHTDTPGASLLPLSGLTSRLGDLEPKYTNFVVNVPPNRNGRLETSMVNLLTQAATMWSPNAGRAALPTQPLRVDHPITARSAYSSDTLRRPVEPPHAAIDGISDLNHQTCFSNWPGNGFPQTFTIDLGGLYENVSALEYVPKPFDRDGNNTNGDITDFAIETSADGTTFTQRVASTWTADTNLKFVEWSPVTAAYVRIRVNAATGGYINLCEVRAGSRTSTPTLSAPMSPYPASGYHRLFNRTTQREIDSRGAGTTSGSFLAQWDALDSQNFHWQIEDAGGGYYRFISRVNGLAIDGVSASAASGSDAELRTLDMASMTQQWRIERVSRGYVRVCNRASSMCLDGNNGNAGSAIVQRPWPQTNEQQMWTLELVP